MTLLAETQERAWNRAGDKDGQLHRHGPGCRGIY